MALTAKQRRLCAEIEEISSIIGTDFWDIEKYKPEVTTRLEIPKNQLVRGRIIMSYTMIDEFLSVIIANYYFAHTPLRGKKSFPWRSRKFHLFCHYVLDTLSLLQKLDLVHAIRKIPKDVSKIVTGVNNLRNPIAHSLFPENRRQYKIEKKVMYRGLNIFTPAGIQAFMNDVDAANDYFMERAFGKRG
jgi:hypothetical protein